MSFRLLEIFRRSVITPFCVFGSPDEERHVVDDGKQGNFHRAKPEKIFFVSKLIKVKKEILAFISLVTRLTIVSGGDW